MLGGMIGPMVAAEASRAALKLAPKPARRMAGMRMAPVPAASAVAEPDMPAMIMLLTTAT
jgi:hypothetical protein